MVLGDAAADLDDRRLLEGVGADHRRADLAGNGQHRDAVELGVGDGGDQVGSAGAAGGHADADLAGRAGVALGGEAAPLLVAGEDHANAIAEAGQGLVQRRAVYAQFCRVAPCKQFAKGHGEIGSPERERYGTIYPWAEIADKPQGAMIF